MEGHYATGPADITPMGWVDESSGTVRGPGLAGAGSYLLNGDPSEPVPGLNEVAPAIGRRCRRRSRAFTSWRASGS